MISVVVISKDEPFLDSTLGELEAQVHEVEAQGEPVEILVVDASEGRLAAVQEAHPAVRWLDFAPRAGAGVTIPHQRNTGVFEARGDVIVFTDAGCTPQPHWLSRLVHATRGDGEDMAAGAIRSAARGFRFYETALGDLDEPCYLEECPTTNLAFRRQLFDSVGGFDESFQYGSDVDFSWRARDAGFRIRAVPDAVIAVDWGGFRRQLKRSHAYGRARVRLYRKHRDRLPRLLRADPVVVVWPLFIIGLPLAARYPQYLLLLAIPAWRARHSDPVRTIVDHLSYGCGVLRELVVS